MARHHKKLLLFSLGFMIALPLLAADPLKGVAVKISKSLKDFKNPTVGLLAFPYHDGKLSSGSSIVCERLTTYMAEMKGIKVIERRLIQKLLQEQKLSETGLLDQKTANQIGKILGVNIIITGTLIDVDGTHTEVNARGITIETGEVISASRATIKTSWPDKPRLPESLRPKEPPLTPPQPETKVDDEPIKIGYPGGRGRGYWR